MFVLLGPPPRVHGLRELRTDARRSFALDARIGGTGIAALLIFRPAHRRLRGLESAARQLGAGRSDVRAPEVGGDEISAVARSFNDMASEIVRRARRCRSPTAPGANCSPTSRTS